MNQMENKYAVIAIGYNRVPGMLRLLESLEAADYMGDRVTLIISIDNSGSDDVEKAVAAFNWTHGEKKIVTYPERQGLRKHILKCGDWLKEYEAVAVFEDDLVVSPAFYKYMKQTVPYYEKNGDIAGISFYNHLWNVSAYVPFQPAYSDSDVYFIQFAQSWGQIWLRDRWFEFKAWYEENSEEFKRSDNVPDAVTNWGKNSWLKYHVRYCIEKNKYFVYPYHALSTCFSDKGEHSQGTDIRFQIPMQWEKKADYNLLTPDSPDAVKYDAFFERILEKGAYNAEINFADVCFDLYGSRNSYGDKRYVLSRKQLPYKIVRGFALNFRPHEMNFLLNADGDDCWLYDRKEECGAAAKDSSVAFFRYHFRLFRHRNLLIKYTLSEIKAECTEKMRSIRKRLIKK